MFDECRHFLVIVFPFREDEINTLFPNVIDFEDDVFALVERKESMEKFLREIVMTMDFLVYRPLFYFLNPHDEFRPVERKVTCIQSTVRMHFTKKKMIQLLGDKYAGDLKRITGLLVRGLKVRILTTGEDGSPTLVNRMLWLHENTADPGLSRLCCSTMAEFFALTARDDEDGDESERERISGLPPGGTEALAQQTDGLYLSDIAEIRCGLASYDFCLCQAAAARLCQPDASGRGRGESSASDGEEDNSVPREMDCVVIVGSERTINLQLCAAQEDQPTYFLRDWFVDMLSLLAMKSLGPEECVLRNKRWVKSSFSWWLFSHSAKRHTSTRRTHSLDASRKQEAEIFSDVLLDSIQVEEEVCDRKSRCGSLTPSEPMIEDRAMWLELPLKRFFIDKKYNNDLSGAQSPTARGLDVDDIAEIRPGRVSFSCDGTSHMPSLTIVGSETCITLPLDSVAIRNALLRQFQSFLMMFRSDNRSAYRSSVTMSLSSSPLTPSGKTKHSSLLTPDTLPSSPSTPSRASQLLSNGKVSSSKIRRRKSTPASLNKSFSRNDQMLWVRPTDTPTDEDGYTAAEPSVPLSSSAPSPGYVPRRHSTGVTPSRSVLLNEGLDPSASANLSNVLEFEDDELRRQFKKTALGRPGSPASTSSRGTSKSGGTQLFQQISVEETTRITAN